MPGKEKLRSLLIGLATALLVGQAIYSPARMLLPFGGDAAPDSSVLQDHLEAFGGSETLRSELRDHPIVGYVAPEPVDTTRGRITEMRYYLAQFALAPTLIAPHAGYPVVFANFWQAEQLQRFLAAQRARTLVQIDPSSALLALPGD